ncbi:hypothetical protein ACIBG0_40810 [Nocardia sp. NPDC050630]
MATKTGGTPGIPSVTELPAARLVALPHPESPAASAITARVANGIR